MAYKSKHPLFRSLTDEEEEQFRNWARWNRPDNPTDPLIHPVIRDEWSRIAAGKSKFHGCDTCDAKDVPLPYTFGGVARFCYECGQVKMGEKDEDL